ncbi:hypothetical protein NDU88_001427 [Pleurodeles waltl]|uniref:Uncharacterized protein n=1 Tax=Pleurodeles waltl TaxID=8319 RepID=A0AAV7USR0_PLEWA|nr:hypothetical protein NDU88_001427 [Pleurodeles waltl]
MRRPGGKTTAAGVNTLRLIDRRKELEQGEQSRAGQRQILTDAPWLQYAADFSRAASDLVIVAYTPKS